MPLVSVYLPTRNRVLLLARAVQSVLTQTEGDHELIIVDDGSTDGTHAYLEQLTEQHENVRVLYNEHRLGACASRNRAIMAARADLVTGIDDDDEFLPDRLRSLIAAFRPSHSLVTSTQWWDHGGKRRKLLDGSVRVISFQDQLRDNYATSQVLCEREKLIAVGMFDPRLPSCQDWDMWTRLVDRFGDGIKLTQPSYVVHTSHHSPRISEDRVRGLEMFYANFGAAMNEATRTAFELGLRRTRGDRLSFVEGMDMLPWKNLSQILKLWARTYLPFLLPIRRKLARVR